jgi:hypothetical protein
MVDSPTYPPVKEFYKVGYKSRHIPDALRQIRICHEVTSEGHGIGDALLDGGFCGVGLKATRLSKRIGEDGASKREDLGSQVRASKDQRRDEWPIRRK